MASTNVEPNAMRTAAQRFGCRTVFAVLFDGGLRHGHRCLRTRSTTAGRAALSIDPTTGLITSETVEPDNIAFVRQDRVRVPPTGTATKRRPRPPTARAPFRSDSNSTLAPQLTVYAPTPAQTVTIGGTTMNVPQGMFRSRSSMPDAKRKPGPLTPALAFPCSLIGPNQLSTNWQVGR